MKQFKYHDRTWEVCQWVEPETIKTVQEEKSGNRTLLQENKVRASYFFRTENPRHPLLFVKKYKPGGWRDMLKYLFLPSKAKQEWENLCRFRKKTIKCPVPVAFSETKGLFKKGSSYLVTEAVEDAIALNKYAETTEDTFERKLSLCKNLGRQVRQIHEKGIYYRDLHAGNILIKGSDTKEIFFTDLHRAFCFPYVAEFFRLNDVAKLCSSLSLSSSLKSVFLKNYCMDKKSFRRFFYKAAKRAQKIKDKHIKSRTKRCVKNSTVFEVKKRLTEKYCGRKEFGYARTGDFIEHHKRAVVSKNREIVKQTEKSAITVHSSKENLKVAVKANRYTGFLYFIKSFLTNSRAMKSWKASHGLSVRGFKTPEGLSVVEKRKGFCLVENFLLTRWLEDSMELNDYIKESSFNYQQRRGFIIAFSQTIRHLHGKSVYQADLKSNNILVRLEEDGKRNFYFIDLDRVYFQKKLSMDQRINNLAQINASVSKIITPKDRLRFFYFYMEKNLSKNQRKHYYKKILEISRKKTTRPYDIIFE